jgi:hypothetical protein
MEERGAIALDALGMQITCWNTQQSVIRSRRRIRDSECLVLRLKLANPDLGAFENACRELVKRHEGLRTTFRMEKGVLLQIIGPYRPTIYDPGHLDISCHDSPEEVVDRKIRKAIRLVTNLETGPLVRFFLFRLKPDEYLFVVVIHHIISDAASLEIIRGEIAELYHQFRCGLAAGSYPAYHIWDIVKRQQAFRREKEREYWQSKLRDYICMAEAGGRAPCDFSSYSILISQDLPQMIRATAAGLRVSPFGVLLTAFYLLFYIHENRQRAFFAISVSDRRLESDRNVIGHLMYKIFLGERIRGEETVAQLARHVYLDFLRTCGHPMYNESDYDQAKISSAVDLYLNYLPKKAGRPARDGLHESCSPSWYSLSCFVEDFPGGIRLGWIYDRSIFSAEKIERITREYEGALSIMCNYPKAVSGIKIDNILSYI